MTEPDEPTYAAIIEYKFGLLAALSIDLTEYGVLVVDKAHAVRLLPWHMVTGIEFLDDSAFEPRDDLALPERGDVHEPRHEGSE